MTSEQIIGWRNRPASKPATPAKPARPSGHARAKAALVKSLAPNTSNFMTPLNTGPLNSKPATGVMGSV